MELADAEELVAHAIHPYTRSLLSAIPMPDPRRERNKSCWCTTPPCTIIPPKRPSGGSCARGTGSLQAPPRRAVAAAG